MIRKVLSVRDRAANIYGQPFLVEHLGQGIRSFQDEINSTNEASIMARHPDDFDLYHLADFDDEKGQYTNLELPLQIAVGKQLKLQQ